MAGELCKTVKCCVKVGDNQYELRGLTLNDIEILQEGLARLFNESRREEHRSFRKEINELNRPIEDELDKILKISGHEAPGEG